MLLPCLLSPQVGQPVCKVQIWRPSRQRILGPGTLPTVLGLKAGILHHRPQRRDNRIETLWIVTV